MAAPQILVSGVPAGSPDVQKLIDAAYTQVAAAAGHPATLSASQWQQVVVAVNAGLKQAGHAGAHAYLASEFAAFGVNAATLAAAPTEITTHLPSVPQREQATDNGAGPSIAVNGFSVQGVGQHPKQGITPASIQKLADAELAKHGGGAGKPADMDFDQLQGVADAITKRYRTAGFIVATAYVPAQTVGKDGVVHIDVLEGRIGNIKVEGTKHYKPWVIAASAEKLRGKPLLKSDVDTALLYDRDLPGVSVASTFQPGTKTGDTDLIMVAREAPRPYSVTLGVNNYGTDVTGQYRAVANVAWNNPLGIGDKLVAGIQYAFDPHQNTYGSLGYSVPYAKVPGLAFTAGADRSELQLSSGPFAALHVGGPTSRYFGGAQWKFVNQSDLSMTGSLQYIHEESSLSSLGLPLSDEAFNVAELGFALDHTDKRFHGLDMLNVTLRKSLNDESRQPDLVSPDHAHSFFVAKVGYTRIQFLAPTQQLFFKLAAQYTNDALVPMEQFVIGGPDSVRAYPLADNLSDRGFYSALEYHVDAPGFANKPSPFHGEPWRELLTFEGFVDFARGFPVAADRGFNNKIVNYSGVGAGLIFHLPRWHNLLFHLDGAVPIGSQKASDKSDYHIYGRLDVTF
ncbi:MAG TPA: ShlB/FhaC/HecB family hemolysin secretion/activation protein [Rhodanobacteraceae bacterium]